VTGSSDSLLKVWKFVDQGVHHHSLLTLNSSRIKSADDLQEIEAITLKGRYPLSIGLAKLPQSSGKACGPSSSRSKFDHPATQL
jgi:hypothetical protein